MDIIGVFNPVVDLNLHLKEYPKVEQNLVMLEYGYQGGGPVSTGLCAAARLGAEVGYIGNVGDDPFGRFAIEDFVRHGIDVSHIKTIPEKKTHFCVCLSDRTTMGRALLNANIADEDRPPFPAEEDLDPQYLKQGKMLFVNNISPDTVMAMKAGHRCGLKNLIDLCEYKPEYDPALPLIDIFVASKFFYDEYFGADNKNYEENCKKLQSIGPSIVVFTFGRNGCLGVDEKGEYFELPAFIVDTWDTTGCGDVFHGAFAAGLAKGLSVKEAARLASATAAIKSTRVGGRAGIPNLETVERFLRDGVIDYTEIDQRVEFYRNVVPK